MSDGEAAGAGLYMGHIRTHGRLHTHRRTGGHRNGWVPCLKDQQTTGDNSHVGYHNVLVKTLC